MPNEKDNFGVLKQAAAVVLAISAIGGAAWALENHWTPRMTFEMFQKQYNIDRATDTLYRTNDRLYDIEQKLKKNLNDESLSRERNNLIQRKKILEKQLKVSDDNS